VFTDSNDKPTDSFDPDGMKWFYIDNIQMSKKVKRLYKEGIEDSVNGRYEESISKLIACITEQTNIPTLYYDLAYTYVLFNKPQEALEIYEKLDEITPTGYALTKTYIHMLKKEIKGELAPGFTLFYTRIEDMDKTVEKVSILKDLIEAYEYYPPLVKEYLESNTESDYVSLVNNALVNDIDSDTKYFLLNYLALRLIPDNIIKSTEIWQNIEKAEDSTLIAKTVASMSLDYYSE